MVREREISWVYPKVTYPRRGKTRLNMPKFERSDFYRFGHVTLGYHLSTVLYCCPRSDLVDFTGNKASGL